MTRVALSLAFLAATAVGAQPRRVATPVIAAEIVTEVMAAVPSMASMASMASMSSMASMQGLQGLRGLQSLSTLSSLGTSIGSAVSSAVVVLPYASIDQTQDSLYRMGRRALDRGDYRRAADLFWQVRSRDRRAPIAADALYWHAFASARIGSTAGLETALASLDMLADDFPRAGVVSEARTLRVRVCGLLASQGDERCAREITERASGGSSTSSGSSSREVGSNRDRDRDQEQGCPSENDDERVEALNALLQMDPDAALPILEKTLARRDRCSVTLRRKAVFLVSQKRNAKSADILLNSVKTDPDAEVRQQAVFWIGQLRDDRAVTILEEILRTERDGEVLDKAVFALSQHRSERAARTLRDLAQRDNVPKHQREQAIFWLGQQRSSANNEMLMDLFTRVDDADLKDKIIFSLSQSRSSATDKWMMDLATNSREDIEIRKKALFWAGQNKSVSVEGLTSMYDRMNDREMRDQVIFVLSQRRDGASIEKLIDIAKNERDRELRKKAIFWLGQSKDPRALKAIEELIVR